MKILFILLLALVVFDSELFAEDQPLMNSKVTHHISKLSSPDEPGIQYIVVNRDSSLFEYSAGLADIKNKISLTKNHTMASFSMTKTLTAIGVLQLVDSKMIRLDDQVSLYAEHPYNPNITIRHLINHTSGIPNPIPLKWIHLAKNHHMFDEKKALAQVLVDNSRASSSPGEEYKYSNIGYWLLGIIIEKVSGLTYSDYMYKFIFEPLDLTKDEIGFVIRNGNNHAKGYLKKYSFMNLFKSFLIKDITWGEYEGRWLHINDVYLNGPAFGGAIGSAKAFSRILQSLLSENSVLLGNDVKQYLYSQEKTKSGNEIEMTLGWHIGELDDERYYFKEGGGAGFHCEMRIYPDRNLASVLMVNRTSFNTRKQLSNLDKLILGGQKK